MDFLARREYGQQELIDKLSGKGFARDIAEQAILTLTSEGLQSDQRFAEASAADLFFDLIFPVDTSAEIYLIHPRKMATGFQ